MQKKKESWLQDPKPETAKRTIKDSVFTDLFQDKKYLIQLYQTLHPEDTAVTEADLTDITINNVLMDNIYNDLGFLVGNRLLILAEAQSTWSVNIVIRGLMYLVKTYQDYFFRQNQSLYKSKKIELPRPELYVIYTGERNGRPDRISLTEEYFDGLECAIEVRIKVIYENGEGDIVNQYIVFSRICNEQRKLYGRSRKAITETIRICRDKNILKEYLESREKEVVDIMVALYDEEEVLRSYIASEKYETAKETAKETVKSIAERMLRTGKLTIEEIGEYFPELSSNDVERLASEVRE